MLKIFTILVLCLFVFPGQVHAYLDPSTGSYLFQVLIAGALGGVYYFRGHIFNIKNKLNSRNENKKKDDKKKDEKKKS